MKSKKTVLAAVLTLMLALSIVTVSATAASANVKKSGEPVNNPCIAAADVSGECAGRPLEGFIENLSFLSEQEKSKLLADLAEIEKYENQINEICSLMTDENAERLCAEIDAVDEKLTAVLERNAALWERVNDEYGNTKRAVERLISGLRANGCPNIAVYDLARCDMSAAVADAFRYGKLVLATTTYNADIFPPMRHFIEALTERNYQKRTVALIENGSWAPLAAKVMRGMLENSADITFASNTVKLLSAPDEDSNKQLDALAEELCREYLARRDETANKNDLSALFNLGYGLYVVTSNDGKKDNGLIVNTVSQVTNTPNRIAVTINKENYSHHIIKQTGIMNVNCLSTDAPFSVFETFGFQSGRTTDKFASCEPLRSDNGLVFLPKYINSFMSLKVMQYVDFDTHGMFICEITEARVISDRETMTYTYYQKHVKPKPQTEGRKGYVCKVCGYVYEGEELPEDFICPLCKHGAADFEPIG